MESMEPFLIYTISTDMSAIIPGNIVQMLQKGQA